MVGISSYSEVQQQNGLLLSYHWLRRAIREMMGYMVRQTDSEADSNYDRQLDRQTDS